MQYSADTDYNYGIQGMEKDKATGENDMTTHWRGLDQDVVRWLSRDPKWGLYPNNSPYITFGSNPISLVDPLGDTEYWTQAGTKIGDDGIKNGVDYVVTDKAVISYLKERSFGTGLGGFFRRVKSSINRDYKPQHLTPLSLVQKEGAVEGINMFKLPDKDLTISIGTLIKNMKTKGRGGDPNGRAHEEGLLAAKDANGKDIISFAKPGLHGKGGKGANLSVDLYKGVDPKLHNSILNNTNNYKDRVAMHIHPNGTFYDFESGITKWFEEYPSYIPGDFEFAKDIEAKFGITTNIVVTPVTQGSKWFKLMWYSSTSGTQVSRNNIDETVVKPDAVFPVDKLEKVNANE